jgi:hypothetical protein
MSQLNDQRESQRKSAVRTALALGVVAVAVYIWAIVTHL